MEWANFGLNIISSMIGAAVPLAGFIFWLGKVSAELGGVMKRCENREKDHTHHYAKINDHSIRLENHERRIVVLEKME